MNTIREICFDADTGRLILSDNNDNHFLCDIYGKPKIVFLPYVTGTVNGTQRNKKNELQLTLGKSMSQKDIQYFPSIRKFEGYSQFPRPLVPPFSNRPTNEYSSSAKQKLIETLKKMFPSNRYTCLFNSPNRNKGLSYMTCDLNKCDIASVDASLIIKLIDETIAKYKEDYKYKLNLLQKNPTVKALSNFRKVILENKDMKIINGRLLPEPSMNIKLLSNCVDRVIEQKKKKNTVFQLPKTMTQFTTTTMKSINTIFTPRVTPKTTTLKDKEISFLSVEEENSEATMKNERELSRIKSTENMKKKLDREIKLMTGIIDSPVKEEKIFRKYEEGKLRTNGELYLKNISLLRKVNPIAYQLEENKDKFDLKQLERRKKQKLINQMNVGFEFKK